MPTTLIEQRAGKTIAAIFADDGRGGVSRSGSRRWSPSCAAGGGRSWRWAAGPCCGRRIGGRFARRGPVVWLTASVDTILERLAADPTTASRRPNLTTAGGRAEVEALLAERTPLYRECATLVVDTEGKTAGRSGR